MNAIHRLSSSPPSPSMRQTRSCGAASGIAVFSAAIALLAACGGGGGGGSSPPPPPAEASTALVITTDFQTGSYALLPLDDPSAAATNVGQLHSDAVARVRDGIVYVINRLGADNVQAIDPARDFATLWQCSVGNGSNPHDIVIASPDKAYVTLYDRTTIAIVDPSVGSNCQGFLRGEIDLAAFADDDGIPELDQMIIVGDRLYVSLLLLDRDNFFSPTESSLLAVIDTDTEQLVDVDPSTPALDGIRLSATNPFADSKGLTLDPRSGKILLSETGSFGVLDGGIETVDPETNRAEGLFVTEAQLGGDITDVVVVSNTRAYAVLSAPDFSNRLVRFDPSTGNVQATLVSTESFLPDIEYEPVRGQLYLADQTLTRPGIRVFAGSGDAELTAQPIGTGLPPFNIVFVE